jgi:hypothetical protein
MNPRVLMNTSSLDRGRGAPLRKGRSEAQLENEAVETGWMGRDRRRLGRPWARNDLDGLSRGDQRDCRGGWKMEVAERAGRSRVLSGTLEDASGRSTGRGSTITPQSSARVGGGGVDVVGGADLFEHEGPEQGLGGGAWSVADDFDPSSRKASRPIPGRSVGCSQPAFAEPGAIRLIARNVRDAPTIALTSRIGWVARMESPIDLEMLESEDASRWVNRDIEHTTVSQPPQAPRIGTSDFSRRALGFRPRRKTRRGRARMSGRPGTDF